MDLTDSIGVLAVVLGAALLILKRILGKKEDVSPFKQHVDQAESLEAEIQKLKKESVRDTVDFEEALKKHRAKFGSSKRTDDEPRG